jgi:hypothetical protein
VTVRELGADALRELNVIGVEDTLEADEGATCLRYFTRMVDAFQTDRNLLFTVARTVFALVANQQAYTIGAAGTHWVGARPLWLEHVGVIPVGADYEIPVDVYPTRKEWLAESIKDLTDLYPRRYLYEPTSAALGTFTFWPIPTTAAEIALASPAPLTTPVTLDTALTFPPGYEEAWVLCLARRLARPFEVVVTPDLDLDARQALGRIRRLNDGGPPLSRSDDAVLGPGGYDIRSGLYR